MYAILLLALSADPFVVTHEASTVFIVTKQAGCPCNTLAHRAKADASAVADVLVPRAHEAVSHPDVLDQWLAAAKQQRGAGIVDGGNTAPGKPDLAASTFAAKHSAPTLQAAVCRPGMPCAKPAKQPVRRRLFR